MGQVSPKLRSTEFGFVHWCPGCGTAHEIRTKQIDTVNPKAVWSFDGNLDVPTFNPSIRIGGVKAIYDNEGNWIGEWERDKDGKPIPSCCHYFLHNGRLNFCSDCTHYLASVSIPLPDLPQWLMD